MIFLDCIPHIVSSGRMIQPLRGHYLFGSKITASGKKEKCYCINDINPQLIANIITKLVC